MIDPPADVAPEVLFRKLLELPRPSVDIDYRVAGAEQIPLRVQALTAAELAGSAAYVAFRALLIGTRPAFGSVAELEQLFAVRELEQLRKAVMTGLARCAPVDGRSNWTRWQSALLAGARHITNHSTAYALGSQVELLGKLAISRPERFFGVAPIALVDAHRFATRAAVAYFFEVHKNS